MSQPKTTSTEAASERVEPHTFDSTVGGSEQTWRLEFDVTVAKRLKRELGLDVGNLRDGKLFLDFAFDHFRLAAALWLLCEEQADREGIDEEAFGRMLKPAVLPAAVKALEGAVVNFTPPALRATVRAAIAKAHNFAEVSSREQVATINSREAEQAFRRRLKKEADKAKRLLSQSMSGD